MKELQTNLATYNEQLDQVRRLILNLFFLLVDTVVSLSRAGLKKMASVRLLLFSSSSSSSFCPF